jgi:hypothetical protein
MEASRCGICLMQMPDMQAVLHLAAMQPLGSSAEECAWVACGEKGTKGSAKQTVVWGVWRAGKRCNVAGFVMECTCAVVLAPACSELHFIECAALNPGHCVLLELRLGSVGSVCLLQGGKLVTVHFCCCCCCCSCCWCRAIETELLEQHCHSAVVCPMCVAACGWHSATGVSSSLAGFESRQAFGGPGTPCGGW